MFVLEVFHRHHPSITATQTRCLSAPERPDVIMIITVLGFSFSVQKRIQIKRRTSLCLSLNSRQDEALLEGGVDPVAHDDVFSVTDGGGALDMLQASDTASTHATVFA